MVEPCPIETPSGRLGSNRRTGSTGYCGGRSPTRYGGTVRGRQQSMHRDSGTSASPLSLSTHVRFRERVPPPPHMALQGLGAPRARANDPHADPPQGTVTSADD